MAILTEFSDFLLLLQKNGLYLLEILAYVWAFNLADWLLRLKLYRFGLIPRKLRGLIGIFTNIFLHQNFNHLFFNSFPFLVLGAFIYSLGSKLFIVTTTAIALLSSVAVWCFARRGNHIGASGLISGYFGFILVCAYQEPSVATLISAVIAVYYFGSIFLGLFPGERDMSWEGHLFGFLAGLAVYFLLPYCWSYI
jgi:membrane associated rhomboid family serine protease